MRVIRGQDEPTSDPLGCDRLIVPLAWCKSGFDIALSGGVGRKFQAATAGSLTMGSSLNGAMVSSVM